MAPSTVEKDRAPGTTGGPIVNFSTYTAGQTMPLRPPPQARSQDPAPAQGQQQRGFRDLDALNPLEVKAGMERVVPVLKEGGGYIFSSDHSVPSNVSLEDFRQITTPAKKLDSY